MGFLGFLAQPLGWILQQIYHLIPVYFIALFVFTLLVRLVLFPLSLKSQKSQAERARLAPRLERLQKKYGGDPQKFQQKQQELYEKEGVSLTGGCLPLVVQMIVLFGVISAIYAPINYLTNVPDKVIDASVSAITLQEGEVNENKEPANNLTGYYKELRLLNKLEVNHENIVASITALDGYDTAAAEAYYDEMLTISQDFNIFGLTLLENPWNGSFSILWLIPLISGVTALLSAWISMRYAKAANPKPAEGQKVPGQGCSNNMMLIVMPLFSTYIAFIVPGGVGVYWIFSNLLAMVQTMVMNKIYDPAKYRALGEQEFEERRRRKAEDKRRLAEAREREQALLAEEEAAEPVPAQPKKKKDKEQPVAEEPADPSASDAENS